MARPEWGDVVMPFSFFFFIFFRRFWKGSFRTKYKNVDLMIKVKWHKADVNQLKKSQLKIINLFGEDDG